MGKEGEIRLFKLGQKDYDIAVVYMKDYQQHLKKCCTNNSTVGNNIEPIFIFMCDKHYEHAQV